MIKTDISIAIPTGTNGCNVPLLAGYYGRVAPRSSLAWKNHIDVGAGVIDEDYRGPLGVVLFNHGDQPFQGRSPVNLCSFLVNKGDRVAQLILTKIITPVVLEVDELDETVRGGGQCDNLCLLMFRWIRIHW